MIRVNEYGRSMIEMLGVLAIVGVLSVGGMSGYSKAMTKYKMNKQVEQYSSFINNLIILSNSTDLSSLPYRPTEILRYFNVIPEGMPNTGNGIRDVWGNDCHIPFLGKYISLQPIFSSVDQCINAIKNVAIPYSYYVNIGITNVATHFYSDLECNNINKMCLRDITTTEIIAYCEEYFPSGRLLNIQIKVL